LEELFSIWCERSMVSQIYDMTCDIDDLVDLWLWRSVILM